MFVEVREVGGKKKYYLVHSFRHDQKVRKIRRYLGTNLNKAKLRDLRQVAEKQIIQRVNAFKKISDPLLEVLSEEEIQKIKELQDNSQFKVLHLSEEEWQRFSEVFTYNTNAIEGSKLNQKEVKELLEEDKWPDKSKEDIAEAFGVDEAIQFIRGTKEHISIDLIKKIHKIVFKNSKPFAGKLRKKGEEVVVMDTKGNVVHEGAPQTRINYLLKELILWYVANKTKYPGLVLGAVIHNQFENIHPFADGNGRTARLVEALLLRLSGIKYVPVMLSNFYYRNIDDYYWAFYNSINNKENNVTSFLEFVFKGLIESLNEIKDRITFYIRKFSLRHYYDLLRKEGDISQRQHDFLIMVLDHLKSFALKDLHIVSPLRILYSKVSSRTAIRDLKKLYDKKLLTVKDGKYELNFRILG